MKWPLAIWLAQLAAATLTPAHAATPASPTKPTAGGSSPLVFERDVRPLLKTHCFHCHGEDEKREGGLDVRLRRFIVAGGDSGPAVVPGNRSESYLLDRVLSGEMPPGKKKLSAAETAMLVRWVEGGAPTARPEPEKLDSSHQFTDEELNYWAFQPIRVPSVPQVKNIARVRTPIDAFLLAKLEEQKLTFSPDADKRTLIRRATFDLLGLPPTPEEVSAFLADDAPDAYDRLIDRLLASPHYGERWGRHWLDVAGYADSDGYNEQDTERKHAWRYRDYVIRSFNADKPLNEFIVEQLAGDELIKPPYTNLTGDAVEKLVATGFLRMAPDGTASAGAERKAVSNQVVADTIRIVSSSLLGMTVACAQCHDHRYDPISQADYYRMRAIFEPAFDWKDWRLPQARLVSLYTDADRQQAKEIESEAAKIDAERLKKQQAFIEATFDKEVAKLPEDLREPARKARATPAKEQTPEQKKLLKENPSLNVSAGSLYLYDGKAADELKAMVAEAAKIRARKPVEGFVQALCEVPGKVPATHLFARGDFDQPKQVLPPGELLVLAAHKPSPIPEKDTQRATSGRRLTYAQWLTSGRHPLVARVLANRFWLHHFGRGIVASPGDFGVLGERPTHPELLDWLAADLTAGGWRLKRLHKLLMTSTAYRQTSSHSDEQETIDPDNKFYGHKSVTRLDAEAFRDAVLANTGRLNVKMFGEAVPVMPDQVGQFIVGKENTDAGRPGAVIPMNGEDLRRSIYVQVRRSRPLSVLSAFDAPLMEPNCEVRSVSTVAPQALLLMNNDFVVTQADEFARRVRREAGDDPREQVLRAWRLALTTEPPDDMLKNLVEFLAEQTEHFTKNPPVVEQPAPVKGVAKPEPKKPSEPAHLALATMCQALWSSNAFLYVD